MTLLDLNLLGLILILVFLILPIALIYGKVKKISELLEAINDKMGPGVKPDIKPEEKETEDDIKRFT